MRSTAFRTASRLRARPASSGTPTSVRANGQARVTSQHPAGAQHRHRAHFRNDRSAIPDSQPGQVPARPQTERQRLVTNDRSWFPAQRCRGSGIMAERQEDTARRLNAYLDEQEKLFAG